MLIQHFFNDGVTRNVRFGKSFYVDSSDDEQDQYHSVTYDFKPPSGAHSTSIDMRGDRNVSITVGHDDSTTTYRGSAPEATRDCFLIYDPSTDEYVIEKVKRNIRVKRTRDGARAGGAPLPPTTSPRDVGGEAGGAAQAVSSMPMFDANSDDEQDYRMDPQPQQAYNQTNHQGNHQAHQSNHQGHQSNHQAHQAHQNNHQQFNQHPRNPQNNHQQNRNPATRPQNTQHSSYNNQSSSSNQQPPQEGEGKEDSSSSSSSDSSSDSGSDSESEGERKVNNTTTIMGDLEISDDDDED